MYLKIIKYFLILIITIVFQTSNIVFAITEEGEWKPQIVEKMYILPAKQLKKVLSNDFKSSSLAAILNDKDIKIKNRHDKINNLNESVSKFNGEEKIELQHQLIIEKKDYIKDMHHLLQMKKKKLNTKKEFFKNIENKTKIKNVLNKNKNSIIKKRTSIVKRTSVLDDQIFDNLLISNSKNTKYSNEYSKNKSAIESLREAIKKHPMSNLDQNPISENKLQTIKDFIENIETEVAIIELKEQLLNYMAKLVALDAMQLAENLADESDDVNNSRNYNDPNDAIEFFIN